MNSSSTLQSPGALARFLGDPVKVAAAALLLVSIAGLEGWMLWNKLSARNQASLQTRTENKPAPAAPTVASAPAASSAPVVAAPAVTSPANTPATTTPAPKPVQEAIPPTKSASTPTKQEPLRPAPKGSGLESNLTAPQSTSPPQAPKNRTATEPVRPAEPADAKRTPRKPTPAKPAEPVVAQPAPVIANPPPLPAQAAAPAAKPAPPAARALEPLSRVPLQFPLAAARQGVTQGKVKARAVIDAAGNVRSVEILSAYPQRLFDRALVESLSKWKFPPGADGRRYEVDVEFNR